MATTCEPASVVDPDRPNPPMRALGFLLFPASTSPIPQKQTHHRTHTSSFRLVIPIPRRPFPERPVDDHNPPSNRSSELGGMPRVEPSRLAKASLPSFSFNPGASSTQDNSYLSPSPSPPSLLRNDGFLLEVRRPWTPAWRKRICWGKHPSWR